MLDKISHLCEFYHLTSYYTLSCQSFRYRSGWSLASHLALQKISGREIQYGGFRMVLLSGTQSRAASTIYPVPPVGPLHTFFFSKNFPLPCHPPSSSFITCASLPAQIFYGARCSSNRVTVATRASLLQSNISANAPTCIREL